MIKKIVVASLNPVKIEAARLSFAKAFPGEEFSISGVAAVSGVPSQPLSDEETKLGALNRLQSARSLEAGADFYVAFEGGVEDSGGRLAEFAWAAVLSADGRNGEARSALFFGPQSLYDLVIGQGLEVGEATDILFNDKNSKQKIGAVGNFSKGAVTRTDFYVQPGILALLPFIHPELY
ncbi:MAG: DUF84 family protein [Patescibacteria group bacterium]|nr:DUF84 family protein [Patescibacteria group bacterium]